MAKPPAVQTDKRPVDVFKSQLTLAMPTLRHMIPAHISPDKFSAMVVTAVAYDKNLLECSTESLIRETAQAAELGLSLNKSLREADILTVWNASAGRKEAQMRPRYMGLMKLARQSGEIADIYAHVVHEGDDFQYSLGLDKRLHHVPGGAGDVTHAYVVWQTKDGIKAFEVLERKRLDNIRDRSEGYKAFKANKIKSTPWESDYEEMCRKTAVRAGSKYMPISNEKWASAVAADDRGDSSEDPAEFHGSYTDVTDTTPAAPSEAARSATEKLAERIAPASPDRLDPPEGFEGPDYATWGKEAVAILTPLAPSKRTEWRKRHADIIAAAPEEVAQKVEGV